MKAITFILSTLFATQITWAQQQDVTTVNLLSDGSTYTGDMKNNLPHEQGTFVMASGDKYTGEFKNDMPHGQGLKAPSMPITKR